MHGSFRPTGRAGLNPACQYKGREWESENQSKCRMVGTRWAGRGQGPAPPTAIPEEPQLVHVDGPVVHGAACGRAPPRPALRPQDSWRTAGTGCLQMLWEGVRGRRQQCPKPRASACWRPAQVLVPRPRDLSPWPRGGAPEEAAGEGVGTLTLTSWPSGTIVTW